MRGAGRPPLPEGQAKSRVFTLRLTEDEHRAIVAAAGAVPPTVWARETLLQAAQRPRASGDRKSGQAPLKSASTPILRCAATRSAMLAVTGL